MLRCQPVMAMLALLRERAYEYEPDLRSGDENGRPASLSCLLTRRENEKVKGGKFSRSFVSYRFVCMSFLRTVSVCLSLTAHVLIRRAMPFLLAIQLLSSRFLMINNTHADFLDETLQLDGWVIVWYLG